MTKAQLLKTITQVERLIAPPCIDTLGLQREEASRLERARTLLATVTGSGINGPKDLWKRPKRA